MSSVFSYITKALGKELMLWAEEKGQLVVSSTGPYNARARIGTTMPKITVKQMKVVMLRQMLILALFV